MYAVFLYCFDEWDYTDYNNYVTNIRSEQYAMISMRYGKPVDDYFPDYSDFKDGEKIITYRWQAEKFQVFVNINHLSESDKYTMSVVL